MDISIFILLLGTAVLHAGWNARMKLVEAAPLNKAALFTLAAAILGSPLLIFGMPAVNAWPYLCGAAVFNSGYLILLMHAYHFGPASQVYPLVRGFGVLMVSFLSFVEPQVGATCLTNDTPGLAPLIGVGIIAAGVLLLCIPAQGEVVVLNRRAVLFAISTAVCLASGQVADGCGARLSGNVWGYLGAGFLIQCIVTWIVVIAWAGLPAIRADLRAQWRASLESGVMAVVSYCVAIWAMTQASIPIVVAVRETSVPINALISVYRLKERLRPLRLIATALVFAGLILTRMR